MLVTCHKLKHALELVEPAIPKGKVSLPITANFPIQGGRMMATDLEIAISAALPEATGRAAMCLPFALVKRFLQHIPDTEMLDMTVKGHKTTITAGRMNTVIQGSAPKDFPPLHRHVQHCLRHWASAARGALREVVPRIRQAAARGRGPARAAQFRGILQE